MGRAAIIVVAVDGQQAGVAALVVVIIHVVGVELLHLGGDSFDLLKVIGEGVVQRQEHVVVHVMMHRRVRHSSAATSTAAYDMDQIRCRDYAVLVILVDDDPHRRIVKQRSRQCGICIAHGLLRVCKRGANGRGTV